jgi:hypothetical protein
MVAFEQSIELRIGQLLDTEIEHQAVAPLLERIRQTSRDRQSALAIRLEAIAPHARPPDPVTSASTLEGLSQRDRHPASGSLLAAQRC